MNNSAREIISGKSDREDPSGMNLTCLFRILLNLKLIKTMLLI